MIVFCCLIHYKCTSVKRVNENKWVADILLSVGFLFKSCDLTYCEPYSYESHV